MPDLTRRLATVLFVDIVGSTRVASTVGDRRWKILLNEFRSIARAAIKRHKGREEDTAGDGFFATFAGPESAIRAATEIVDRIRTLGLEARAGLHFGECETIEGRLGGIAVHLGARVMAEAEAGQVLTTTTVRDLVVGAGIELQPIGEHQLKGVDGAWQLWSVAAVDGTALAAPLTAVEASARWEAVRAPATSRRRLLFGIGAVAIAALAVVGVAVAFQPGLIGGLDSMRTTLVRVDPITGQIVKEVHDAYHAVHLTNSLWAINGALWQAVNEGFSGLVRRNIDTGDPVANIALSEEPAAGAFGFGSIWLAGLTSPGSIERWDQVTGRRTATLTIDATIASIDDAVDAMWVLGDAGQLFRVDPTRNSVSGPYASGGTQPGVVVALDDRIWVCDCENHRLLEFDPASGTTVRTLTFPQQGFLAGVSDDAGRKTMWLLDLDGSTVTPIDDQSGEAGQPIGVGENLHAVSVSLGSLWIARGDKLLRRNGPGEATISIPMPEGFSAGAIAVDAETGALWIGDCGCPIQ